ncbi:flagellar hook-length control protein FliK [Bdellovibrionota bacterium FG-2]
MVELVNNSVATVGKQASSEEKPRATKKGKGAQKGTAEASFSDELALSAAATSVKNAPTAERAQAKQGLKSQGEKSELYSSNLDRLPLTQKPAASQNTVSAIAGLKPWSKEWVFEPGDEANPDLKPLLSPKQAPNQAPNQANQKGERAEKSGISSKTPIVAAPAQAGVRGDVEGLAGKKAETEAAKDTVKDTARKQGGVSSLKQHQEGDLAGLAAALAAAEAPQGTEAPQGPRTRSTEKGPPKAPAGSVETSRSPLASQLHELNGTMKVVEGGGGVEALPSDISKAGPSRSRNTPKDSQGNMSPVRSSASGLSGEEFVSTLNSVKSGKGPNLLSGESENSIRGIDERVSRNGPGVKPQLQVLRNDGAELDLGRMGPQAAAPLAVSGHRRVDAGDGVPRAEVMGHVTQGPMTRERLSTESVMGLAAGIKGIAPEGGGEIRVRLKPENLGELHLKITTRGDQVGIQILAPNERTKRILEESISSLKDSLASHKLSIGSFDMSVAKQVSGLGNEGNSAGMNFYRDEPSQNMAQNMSQNFQGGSGSSGSWKAYDQMTGNSDRTPMGASALRSDVGMSEPARRSAGLGQIDVMA